MINNLQQESFPYVRFPKFFWTDKQFEDLDIDAAVLYSYLLDRKQLSIQNGEQWRTKDGAVFVICTIEETCRCVHCKRDKAAHLFRALEEKGLISRIKRPNGKPYHIIVKSVSEISEKPAPLGSKKTTPRSEKSDTNNTEQNKTDLFSKPDLISRVAREIKAEIQNNISFSALCQEFDPALVEYIVDLMAEVILENNKAFVKMGGRRIEKKEVDRRFMLLRKEHICYVISRTKKYADEINSMKGFLLNALFDSFVFASLFSTASKSSPHTQAERVHDIIEAGILDRMEAII